MDGSRWDCLALPVACRLSGCEARSLPGRCLQVIKDDCKTCKTGYAAHPDQIIKCQVYRHTVHEKTWEVER